MKSIPNMDFCVEIRHVACLQPPSSIIRGCNTVRRNGLVPVFVTNTQSDSLQMKISTASNLRCDLLSALHPIRTHEIGLRADKMGRNLAIVDTFCGSHSRRSKASLERTTYFFGTG